MHKTLVARQLVRGPTRLIPGNTGAAAPVPFCRRTGLLPAQEKSLDALGEDVSAAPLPCCNEAINIAILEKTNQHCTRRAGWIW